MANDELTTYDEYVNNINRKLNIVERSLDKLSSLDERLDALVKVSLLQTDILRAGLLTSPPMRMGVPPYNVRQFKLDSSNPFEEVKLSGNYLTFYTDGTYVGTEFAMDSPTNDWVPVTYFGNPYTYPDTFERFYLKWTEQAGKSLWVHIGRRAGASPGSGPPAASPIILLQQTYPLTTYGQKTVGTSIVRLTDTSFPTKLGIVVKADDGNAGNVFVGDSSVTTATGFRLKMAQGIVMEIDDPSKIYLIASVAGQLVYYFGV